MADSYDVVIIGAGPGGYNCAIRAAQLGMKVLVIEKRETKKLGGTCLNVGCIPSKALLHTSHVYEETRDHLEGFGIKTTGVKLDLAAMMAHKDKVVDGNTKGIEFLFKKHKIDHVFGAGRLAGNGAVEVTEGKGKAKTYKAKNIVIATGSESTPLKGIEVDEKRVLTSTGALALESVPKKMVVIGAGYIGLELGSVWRRLGSEVTVVEFLDRITPGLDGEIAKALHRSLKKQGITFKLSSKVTGVKKSAKSLSVSVEPANGKGETETLSADAVLLSIGRRPYTEGLGLEEAGVKLTERGFIETDSRYRTTAEGVWAIGDVIGGALLAHKAEDEGVACAELMAGKAGHVNYGVIPSVVYTWPEVASVGLTEEEARGKGFELAIGKFPFTANARARANDTTEGMVKIIADKTSDRVLGVHMIGAQVSEMIAGAALAMEFHAAAEDIARTCHPHPTLTEAIRQAAMGVEGWTMQM